MPGILAPPSYRRTRATCTSQSELGIRSDLMIELCLFLIDCHELSCALYLLKTIITYMVRGSLVAFSR